MRKPPDKEYFKPKYFAGTPLWTLKGLPKCQDLAFDIYNRNLSFEYLDAPQLLKHALGLSTHLGVQFSLYYLYYDYSGPESTRHQLELVQFTERVGAELKFKAIAYQDIFAKYKAMDTVDWKYVKYLQERYFR